MQPVAVITQPGAIEKILVHLRLPLHPELRDDEATVAYDVTDEPVLDASWRPADDDGWPAERGPPAERDGIDPPAPLGE